VKKNIVCFVMSFVIFIANGQTPPAPAPGGGGSGVSNAHPGVPTGPISDYLYLLVFVGLWYGIKKIKSLSTD
jgi:hypothetical protein